MPSLEKEQLLAHLESVYRPLVRVRDNEQVALRNSSFPSRALAGFSIETLAGVSPLNAASADVDGGQDEGIDSIYYHRPKDSLYLVQGKASGDGGSHQPNLPETIRFINGIQALLSGNLDPFGELDATQKTLIREALQNTALKVFVVLAHFGGIIDEQRTRRIEALKQSYDSSFNEERLFFRNFNLHTAHEALLGLRAEATVDTRLRLESYARHDGDFQCVYGRVKACDLKELYSRHQDALFAQNVRQYRGNNFVNQAVSKTISEDPSKLFYLNNGITALCHEITPTATTAANPGSIGEFDVRNLSVVNGAQTIGSISRNLNENDDQAYVLIKLIRVSEEQALFGERISKATNFQTNVDSIDFLSTHPRLKSMADTLKESGIAFHLKRADDFGVDHTTDKRFTLAEAIEARVCSKCDYKQLVILKTNPSSLYNEAKLEIKRFMPDSLSARTLWREIQICRIAHKAISLMKIGQMRSKDQQFFTHGAFTLKALSLFHLRQLLGRESLHLEDGEKSIARQSIDLMLERALTLSTEDFQSSYKEWNQVFKIQQDVLRVLRINRDPIAVNPTIAATD